MNLKSIICIAAILFTLACKQKSQNNNDVFQPYQKDTIKTSTPDSISKDTIALNTFKEKELEQNVIHEVNLNDRYFLVLASYTVHDFALEMKEKVKSKGFNAKLVMQNDDGWYRLALESYNNKKEATKALQRIQKMGGLFESARIMTK